MHLKETHFKYKDTVRLNVKQCIKMYHSTTNQKKSVVIIY